MLGSMVQKYRWLRENDAFSLLMKPKALMNFRHWEKEQGARPLVMHCSPPILEIELTNRCNLACIQCLRSRGLKPYKLGEMEFDNYTRILAQFPHLLKLSLNGFGEPMMHPRFFDIVAYTRRRLPWCKIGIYSNGMLIDEEKANRLMDCGLQELNISIDAATPETYQRVRRGGKLDVVHANIRRIMDVKRMRRARFPIVGMNFVMLNENEGELVRFVEQAAELGVDCINCITLATYDWGFHNRRTADSYRREVAAARQRAAELQVRVKSLPSEDMSWSEANHPFMCRFFWGENLRITYSGEVTLGCCTPFKETYSYGNVLKTPFMDIWNNAQHRHNRELALKHIAPNKICASCDAYAKRFFAAG